MSVIDSLRRPEHTDGNRYLPCTAVNAALVVVVGLTVNVLSPVAGLVVLVGGALSVYLRGYVVPGTPSFAPQLIGAVGLAGVFDHDDDTLDRRSESLDASVDPDVMLSTLPNAGVLVEKEGGLFLATDAREEWKPTMVTLRKATDEEPTEAIANAVPFEAAVDAEFRGISLDGPSTSVWIPRPQTVTGVATLYTVVERGVDPMIALAVTEPMRMLVEVCPDCGGPVEETTTRNCCGGTAGLYDSPEHEALGCADCGTVAYEFLDK